MRPRRETAESDKATDRRVLALLYVQPVPAIGADGDVERDEIIMRVGVGALASLERLVRDRLVEILGPVDGPHSYRLTRAARACLDAVARL